MAIYHQNITLTLLRERRNTSTDLLFKNCTSYCLDNILKSIQNVLIYSMLISMLYDKTWIFTQHDKDVLFVDYLIVR